MDGSRLQEFLRKADSYAHRPATVRLIETHISTVAIASPFVYKFKKPVNFGWVDFSTLEKREYFCQREIELNSRLCPDLYAHRHPLPLYEHDGILNFERGTVVDYCVAMHEIPPDRFLSKSLPDRHQSGTESVAAFPLEQLVQKLLPFYRNAVRLTIEADAYLARIRQPMLQNLPPFQNYPVAIQPAMLTLLAAFFETATQKHRTLLLDRLQAGCVGDFHGDLHLEHIVLSDTLHEDLCIIDCIEFNDAFRQIDRASDVAFLCMDLDYRGYTSLSDQFCTALVDALADENLRLLQPLFRAYRACVRAKVNILTSRNDGISEEDRQMYEQRAKRYLNLALRYAVAGIGKKGIAVVGRVGSGKSAFARFTASCLGVEPRSSDGIRKELSGLPLLQPTPDELKSRVYDESMSERTYQVMIERAIGDAHSHGITILDATFSSSERREEAVKRFADEGIELTFVEIQAPVAVRKERLQRRNFRPTQSDARLEDITFLDRRYSTPDELTRERIIRADSSQGTREETAIGILMQLIDRALQ